MSREIKLYDPHPGIGGALLPLPKPMRDIAEKLNGQSMSLEEVIKMISPVAEKVGGKVAVVEKHGYISFQIKDSHNRIHLYRLLCYK